MRIYNDLKYPSFNKQNYCNPVSNTKKNNEVQPKHSSLPVTTLRAYNLSFGKKTNLGVWTPNLDTVTIEYKISSPYKDAVTAVMHSKSNAEKGDNENLIGQPSNKDHNGQFLFNIPVLDRETNNIINDEIEIGKIAFYDKDERKLGENQINETISPKFIMDSAIPKSTMVINNKEFPNKVDILSEASVEGIFVKASFDEVEKYNGKDPIIAFLDKQEDFGKLVGHVKTTNIHPNIKGIIGIRDMNSDPSENITTLNGLTHDIARIRGRVAIACMDEHTANILKNNIASINKPYFLRTQPNKIDIKEIDKLTPIEKATITPPPNKMVDKVLCPGDPEFTEDAVGLKAYNLGKLKKLQADGDGGFIVPDFCVVPAGMLEGLEMPEDYEKAQKIDKTQDPELLHQGLEQLREDIIKRELPDNIIPEIKNVAKDLYENNIPNKKGHCLIARSSFNGEDTDKMATQGLYDSFPGLKNDTWLAKGIKQVAASKWSDLAYNARKYHSIEHGAVKPNVIIQEVVPVDYTFTIYTADPRIEEKKKMMMDLSQGVSSACFGAPYIFEYDKTSQTSKRTQLAQKKHALLIDNLPNPILSSLNISVCDYSQDPFNLSQKEYGPIMNKIFNVAQYIEDNFGGRPQDIEGGIIFKRDQDGNVTDADVYIWQTRNVHLLEK